MNLNEDCYYLKKKTTKGPLMGKNTKEIQHSYTCLHNENYMGDKGCPSPNECQGYQQTWIRTLHVGD